MLYCSNDISTFSEVLVQMKLNKLATVQMGYSFRSRLETSGGGAVAVIQMKDLSDDHTVSCDDLARIDMAGVKEHHLAQEGDLVFRSRGSLATAAILLEDPGKAVVSAPLLRIRITKSDLIVPEYLNWYIQQRDAQVFLTSRAKGTVQKMISKHTLEEMEIMLPSLEQQRFIVELAHLSDREQFLLHRLSTKREQYMSAILLRIAKGETN